VICCPKICAVSDSSYIATSCCLRRWSARQLWAGDSATIYGECAYPISPFICVQLTNIILKDREIVPIIAITEDFAWIVVIIISVGIGGKMDIPDLAFPGATLHKEQIGRRGWQIPVFWRTSGSEWIRRGDQMSEASPLRLARRKNPLRRTVGCNQLTRFGAGNYTRKRPLRTCWIHRNRLVGNRTARFRQFPAH